MLRGKDREHSRTTKGPLEGTKDLNHLPFDKRTNVPDLSRRDRIGTSLEARRLDHSDDDPLWRGNHSPTREGETMAPHGKNEDLSETDTGETINDHTA